MKQTKQDKQFKVGDLVETVFGDHLGIVIDNKKFKKQDWYVVHVFSVNEEHLISSTRLRKIS